MKKEALIYLILCLCGFQITWAQSANLDKEYFKVSYVQLPESPILEDSKRTFSSTTPSFRINGFSKVASKGTIQLNYSFEGTEIGEVNIDKQKHEKKDKDGNVVKTTYTYDINTKYTSSATLNVYNAYTQNSYSKNYTKEDSFKSTGFDTYSAAQKYYNNNRYSIRNKHKNKHKRNIIHDINNFINNKYGYTIIENNYNYFWILANKKHPEHAKHQEAYNKLKDLFETMQYNKPVEELRQAVVPIIAYFNDVIPRFPGKKRKIRKVRFASYYNIAKIYYLLDMPKKAKEYAQKIIDNDYDKSDGRYYIRISDDLLESFQVNQTNTRHMEVLTEDISNESEQFPFPNPNGDANTPNPETENTALAYVITAQNDTITAKILPQALQTMENKIDAMVQKNGTLEAQSFSADNTQSILLTTGEAFTTLTFKDVLTGQQSKKFVKPLFVGKKISLYLFKGKEIILAQGEKTSSTLDKSYVFGFNKKLAEMAGSCSAVEQQAQNGEYTNNQDSLLAFCKALEACN